MSLYEETIKMCERDGELDKKMALEEIYGKSDLRKLIQKLIEKTPKTFPESLFAWVDFYKAYISPNYNTRRMATWFEIICFSCVVESEVEKSETLSMDTVKNAAGIALTELGMMNDYNPPVTPPVR